jgi:hypothetical protein
MSNFNEPYSMSPTELGDFVAELRAKADKAWEDADKLDRSQDSLWIQAKAIGIARGLENAIKLFEQHYEARH